MGDTPAEHLYRNDLRRSHELATDLLCYGSAKLPAFDGTLSNVSSYVLNKLSIFAPSARRVLHTEMPSKPDRESLLTVEPRYETRNHQHQYEKMPVVWALNGVVHAKNIWINHIFDRNDRAWVPCGSLLILGFGCETDERRIAHVDLFALAHGFLSRKATYMNKFFEQKGRG